MKHLRGYRLGSIDTMAGGENLTETHREELKRVISTDQTGRSPVTPARGHAPLFVMYDYDSSSIDAEPIKGNSAEELMRAWGRCYLDLRRAGFCAVPQHIGNEISKKMFEHIEEEGLKIEVTQRLVCYLSVL